MKPKDLLADLESVDRTADMLRAAGSMRSAVFDYGSAVAIHRDMSMRIYGYTENQILTMLRFWQTHNASMPPE